MSAGDSISASTRRRHDNHNSSLSMMDNIGTVRSTLRHCLAREKTLFVVLNALVALMLLVVFIYGGQERRGDSVVSVGGSSSANGIRLENDIVVPTIQEERKRNCQIIYVLGVEGATHHGFAPILEYLAKSQVDPNNNNAPYDISMSSRALKYGLFGWYKAHGIQLGFSPGKPTPPVDDPELVRRVLADICPSDGRRHVVVEDNSFPCGQEDDVRSYRVHRQHDWLRMTPEQIADSESGRSQPTDLDAFYNAYSPYADVKFLVLHRPFLETVASHAKWDTGPVVHSNIVRGFMIVLRRFLDTHVVDPVTQRPIWHLICVEKHFAKYYNFNDAAVTEARKAMIRDIATFLDWPVRECPHCFDSWHESTKDYEATLGRDNLRVLHDHMKEIEGTWPPTRECRV